MKKFIGLILTVIAVAAGFVFVLSRSSPKVERMANLVAEVKPWCSKYGLDYRYTITNHAALVVVGQASAPSWVWSGVSALTYCTKGSNSGLMLEVFTFPTAVDENIWLTKDSTAHFHIENSAKPNAVFEDRGWVAILGWNSARTAKTEGQALTTLTRVLGTNYEFKKFKQVNW